MNDREFYFTVRSNAAPFFSDDWDGYVTAAHAQAALERVVGQEKHPCGLYAAEIWSSADAMKKREPALATWRSERALKRQAGIEVDA